MTVEEQKESHSDFSPKNLSTDPLLLLISSCIDKLDDPTGNTRTEPSIPSVRINFSITLLVGGSIVFGTLISSHSYFAEIKHQLSKNKTYEVLGSMLQVINDEFTNLNVENYCIHLREVTIKQGLPAFDMKTPLFRIPIGAVNGFSLGAPN